MHMLVIQVELESMALRAIARIDCAICFGGPVFDCKY
jgi:hypothetical protein